MAILYHTARNTPVLVAANREERFDRPTQPPRIQSGSPRVICGIDRQAGGTWLGVNQYGLLVAVANRPKTTVPVEPRSRGLLCRELLDLRTAREAARRAAEQLATGAYAGANYLCVDAKFGAVVYGGNQIEIAELTPGLHLLTNGDLDDLDDERQEFVHRMLTLYKLDSAVTFLAVASRVFARKSDDAGRRGIIVNGRQCGTVSSSLLALSRKIQHCIYQYADGPPCDRAYDDLSALLRQVLSAEKSKNKEQKVKSGSGTHKPEKKTKK